MFTATGAIVATLVYALVQRFSAMSERTFTVIAIVVFTLSILPPQSTATGGRSAGSLSTLEGARAAPCKFTRLHGDRDRQDQQRNPAEEWFEEEDLSVIGRVIGWYTERAARGRTLDELTGRLEATRQRVAERIGAGVDTPKNRAQACHIIGIERWGQRRLRIALGEPVVADEMDAYCPPEGTSMGELRAAFEETRAETIRLARELERRGVAPDATAPHNEMGELTLRGWLSYLDSHATREMGRIKAA